MKIIVALGNMAGVFATMSVDRGPPIIADVARTGSTREASANQSSGILDLGNPQDSNAELAGDVTNSVRFHPILGVKVWFEDGKERKLEESNGMCPLWALSTGSTTNKLVAAALESNQNGVATFRLSRGIQVGSKSARAYAAQVDLFTEAANYKIEVAFSTEKAPTPGGNGKH